jgi:polysaccharide pyruvyl transferase WcaK-like protein
VKTLFIVGEFDSDNVGDQLIGEGHVMLFDEVGWRVVVAALEPPRRASADMSRSLDVCGLKWLHRRLYRRSIWYRHLVELFLLARDRKNSLRHARTSLLGVDFLVLGGGQLLSDGTLRMLKRLASLTLEARRNGIAIAAFGTGISRPKTIISSLLVRNVLGSLNSKSWFRDVGSIGIAKKFVPVKMLDDHPVPDCAIVRADYLGKATQVEADPRVIGIAPMSDASLRLSALEAAESDLWWVRVMSLLIERGYRPFLFCSGVDADQRRCLRIKAQAESHGLAVGLTARPENSSEFIEILAGMGRVLSQRLHISISYYSIGRTPTSVGWDQKVDYFFYDIGLERRVIKPTVPPAHAVELLLLDEKPTVLPEHLIALSREKVSECMQFVQLNDQQKK